MLFLSMYTFIILTMFMCTAKQLSKANGQVTNTQQSNTRTTEQPNNRTAYHHVTHHPGCILDRWSNKHSSHSGSIIMPVSQIGPIAIFYFFKCFSSPCVDYLASQEDIQDGYLWFGMGFTRISQSAALE